MADMTTWSEKPTRRAWTAEPQLDGYLGNFTIPAASLTFFDGQALGRDASGTIVQMDDTLKAEFVGFQTDVISGNLPVLPTDTLGDKRAKIHRPYAFVALIAAAVAGQEGKKVYWLYNNQVAYTTTQANYAGTVLGVIDSTHVLVLAPWLKGITEGPEKGIFVTGVSGTATLTKWDVNKVISMPLTGALTVNLPAASSVSPGDSILFLNTASGGFAATLTPAGADTINGGATVVMSTVQYATLTIRSDGVSKWYSAAQNVSGTLGATTFSGGITVAGSVVITDAANNALAVGPNGATNPTLNIDGSVASAITGLNIQAQVSGGGIQVSTLGGTNEDLLVVPKGSGGIKVTSTSANSLTVGRQGSTAPTLQVDSSTATCVTGMKLKSAASGAGFAVSFIGGTNEVVTVDTNGSGALTLQSIGTGNVLIGSGCLVNGGTGGIGYGTGVGGTVTQGTSRTTGVTLSKLTGAITLISAAGSATPFTFTVTNTTVAATDTVVASQKSGTDAYSVVVSAVAAGSFKLTVTDLTGTTTETPVINFAVLKGVAA